jgi:hypothetical protein
MSTMPMIILTGLRGTKIKGSISYTIVTHNPAHHDRTTNRQSVRPTFPCTCNQLPRTTALAVVLEFQNTRSAARKTGIIEPQNRNQIDQTICQLDATKRGIQHTSSPAAQPYLNYLNTTAVKPLKWNHINRRHTLNNQSI